MSHPSTPGLNIFFIIPFYLTYQLASYHFWKFFSNYTEAVVFHSDTADLCLDLGPTGLSAHSEVYSLHFL